jgi:hypothetical protein
MAWIGGVDVLHARIRAITEDGYAGFALRR